jgi:hypothetical protein
VTRKRMLRSASVSDAPLTPEAAAFVNRLLPRIRKRLAEAKRIPVGVLLWGPGIHSASPLATVRADLRRELRRGGHAAFFSEELCDRHTADSIRLQQLAQAQEFDLVVSLPCTPGSIAEIHDFAADRRVSAKTLVFVNGAHIDGYGSQSLEAISTVLSCRVERYASETDTSVIRAVTLEEVQRMREMKYILAGRY